MGAEGVEHTRVQTQGDIFAEVDICWAGRTLIILTWHIVTYESDESHLLHFSGASKTCQAISGKASAEVLISSHCPLR